MKRAGELDGLTAVRRFPSDLPIGMSFDGGPQATAHHFMIVGYEDMELLHGL
jgi:hypothetical protein